MFFESTTFHSSPLTAMPSSLTLKIISYIFSFCILLAGDIATNPGPSIIPNTNVCLLNSNTDMVMHFNCRSLLPKVDEPRAAMKSVKPLFIATTETWLNNGISNTEVDINGYCIERHDRNSRGGGVAIYIKDGLKYERKLQLETL